MSPAHVVTADDTALALGSGDVPVLATPRLVAWLEAATVAACPDLDPSETSVGTRVDVEHLVASPPGARVDARAEVVHRDGRLLRFAVSAHHDVGDGPVLIAQGQVTRVVVRRDPFLARLGPDLVIREAVPAEWGPVGDLVVESYRAGYGLSGTEDGYVRVLRDVAGRAAHSRVLVALEGGELVGSVTLVGPGTDLSELAGPGEQEFRFMAVRPDRWGAGVGRALVDAVISRAAGAPLVCSVIEDNEPAAALYRACGFHAQPDRDWQPAPGVLLRAMIRPPD